jgi:folate-dependent phosphoribosylglycinamide formyltransferase PurN
MKFKIVLLARNCDSSEIVYNYLKRHIDFEAVIVEQPFSKIKQLKKRINKLGFWYTMGQVAFMLLVFPVLKIKSQKRKNEILDTYKISLNPLPENKIIKVNTLNSDESRTLLKEINPDLVIVNGTRIISKKTLGCIDAPFINIHVGITPLFRGVHGGYWAIATGKKDLFGVTIHYVDSGVDTGGIIEQVLVSPTTKDNFFTYPFLKYGICMPLLKKIVDKFIAGQKPEPKPPLVNESKLWYHPTIFQWLRNLKRTFLFLFIPGTSEFFSKVLCI